MFFKFKDFLGGFSLVLLKWKVIFFDEIERTVYQCVNSCQSVGGYYD